MMFRIILLVSSNGNSISVPMMGEKLRKYRVTHVHTHTHIDIYTHISVTLLSVMQCWFCSE